MTCAHCPEESVTEIVDATGVHCLCGHCAECYWLFLLQRDQIHFDLAETA